MRAAPAVSVHCTGGVAWRAVQAGITGLAAGAFGFWAGSAFAGTASAVLGVAAMAGAASAAIAALRLSRQRPLCVAWDGQQWRAESVACTLQVMLDLGPWMLLRLRSGPRADRWLAVTAADAGPAWHAWRTAVHALLPAAPAADAEAEPDPAPAKPHARQAWR